MAILADVPSRHVSITIGGGDVALNRDTCVGIYVGDVSGGAVLVLEDYYSTENTYNGVAAGDIIPGRFSKMVDASTTADGLLALLRA